MMFSRILSSKSRLAAPFKSTRSEPSFRSARNRREACLLRGVSGNALSVHQAKRRQRTAIDPQIENVKPVVVPDDVVHLLRLYAAIEVDVGVDDAFVVDQRLADHPAVRPDDAGEGARL